VTSINKEIPIEIFPDDVFLVSYPKSGRTWLRFLIGNYLSGNKSDFTNSHLIVPDIDYNPQQCSQIERPRFIQSHWPFTPAFSRVVYIVRDGRDVAVSYYFHMMKFRIIDKETQFEDFLVNFNKGCLDNFKSWSNHVNLWLDNTPANCLLVVKYEDMKANTVGELIRILEFAEISVDSDAVIAAVEASKFEKMKVLENDQEKLLDVLANTDLSMKFVRNGKVAEHINYFTDELMAEFIEIHGSALERLGYLPNDRFGRFEGKKVRLDQTSQLKAELEQAKLEQRQLQAELEHLKATIRGMESSKFWQMRLQWFKLKKIFNLVS
jgi:hypothetical protein